MKLPTLENIKKVNLKDTNTLTIIFILVIIVFAIIYVWLNKKTVNEGFEQYNVNAGDFIALADLNNVLVGTTPIPNVINNLIDERNAMSIGNTYAKASDLATINTNLTSNASSLATTITAMNSLRDKLTTDLDIMSGWITSNVALVNNNLASTTSTLNNNLTSTTSTINGTVSALATRVSKLETDLSSNASALVSLTNRVSVIEPNSLQYIGGYNWVPTLLRGSVANGISLGFTENNTLLIFNYVEPTLVQPINITPEKLTLPALQPNTYYYIILSLSHWCWSDEIISKLYCIDPNNGNSKSISNINNNNSFFWNIRQHLSFTYNFVVKTSPGDNPNIAIYINSNSGIAQDTGDKFNISIFKINNPSANIMRV